MRYKFVTAVKLSVVAIIVAGTLPVSQASAASAPARPELGITTGGSMVNMKPALLQKRLQDIKRLGATWIRVDFSWSVIQAKNAQTYDFARYDKVVIAAERAGLKVMGVLTYTPKWARNTRCSALAGPTDHVGQKCAPRSAHEFAVFAKIAAYRYRTHAVYAWEIWNEPNLLSYWRSVNNKGNLVVDPVAYGKLATRAANAIHVVDPKVTVVTGGLAPMFEPTPARGMRQSDYLRAMLPHLTRGGVTAIGIHPYSWPATPNQPALWNAFYTLDHGGDKYNLTAIIGRAHRTDLELWGTEFGATTVGVTRTGLKPSLHARPDHVTEARQARIIQVAVQQWYAKRNTGPLFLYADADKYLPQDKNEGGFGLRRLDGTAKPSYVVLLRTFAATQAIRK